MAKHSSDIPKWARRGAKARWHELQAEASSLVKAFPHLRDAVDRDELPVSFIIKRGADRAAGTGTRRRKPMSAAAKKAVGVRMKKYWAERRNPRSRAT
jgi:hypothetical protein